LQKQEKIRKAKEKKAEKRRELEEKHKQEMI